MTKPRHLWFLFFYVFGSAGFWLGVDDLIRGLLGVACIAVYAFIARPGEDDADAGEVVDANYFLGFLFTLTYLCISLVRGHGSQAEIANWLPAFSRDMGVGLGFSVFGLLARQFPLLAPSWSARGKKYEPSPTGDPGSSTGQGTGAPGLRAGVADTGSSVPPDHFHELLSELEQKITATIEAVSGAGGALRGQVEEQGERLSMAVGEISKTIKTAQENLERAIAEAGSRLEVTQRAFSTQAEGQLRTWVRSVEESQALLVAAQSALDGRVKEALEGVATSSQELTTHATSMVERIQQLPDPSRHLEAVWNRLAAAEGDFTSAVSRGTEAMASLAQATSGSVGPLQSIGSTTADISKQNADLQRTIQSDIKRVGSLIEELFELLETWVRRGRSGSR